MGFLIFFQIIIISLNKIDFILPLRNWIFSIGEMTEMPPASVYNI
ncbi:hypothetical protein Hanom_Chr12g01157121 [Helianthus anomalus]